MNKARVHRLIHTTYTPHTHTTHTHIHTHVHTHTYIHTLENNLIIIAILANRSVKYVIISMYKYPTHLF